MGLWTDWTVHPFSHLGSSFPAVVMDSHTKSPTTKVLAWVTRSKCSFCWLLSCALFSSTKSWSLLEAGLDRVVHHNLFLWEEVASVQSVHTYINSNGETPVEEWSSVLYAYNTSGRYCSQSLWCSTYARSNWSRDRLNHSTNPSLAWW